MTLKAARTLGFPLVIVGDHIKKRRLELGLFQRDAAKLLGVDPSTVKNWERGYRTVPIRSYPAVQAFLGYDPYPEPQTLAERLQAFRRRKGWKVRTAAKSIGVDEDTWRLWEAGKRRERFHEGVLRKLWEGR